MTDLSFTSAVFAVEVTAHVGTLWLANEPKRNAMGPAFWEDLPKAIDALLDAECRVIVLAARGPHFTVGLDLKSMGGSSARVEGESQATARRRMYQDVKRLQASITAVANCPVPVVVAIHGWCIGGGIDLICAADIRLASADAKFSVRETRVAITADVGTLQRLPKVVTAGHVDEQRTLQRSSSAHAGAEHADACRDGEELVEKRLLGRGVHPARISEGVAGRGGASGTV